MTLIDWFCDVGAVEILVQLTAEKVGFVMLAVATGNAKADEVC